MKLFLLRNIDNDLHAAVYDVANEFVIAARNEVRARELALEACCDEGPIWLNPLKSSCKEIGISLEEKEEHVVVCSFNAG